MSAAADTAPPTVRRTIDQPTIDAWADISGDRNPLHIDPEYAAGTRFGTTIAHGHLSLAWMTEAAVTWWGPEWLCGGALERVRFTSPVRPGATVRIDGEFVASDDDRRRCRITVTDESDGTLCVVGTAVVPS